MLYSRRLDAAQKHQRLEGFAESHVEGVGPM